MRKSFRLPMIHDFDRAVEISESRRDQMVTEIFQYFEDNPNEPYYFIATGNTMIFGVNGVDEITISDCIARKEYTVFKGNA